MTWSPWRSILAVAFTLCSLTGYGQELNQYRYYKSLINSPLEVSVESVDYPDILRGPAHGSLVKYKLSFEDRYRIRYTAAAGFTGLDTVVYRTDQPSGGGTIPQFEGFVVEVSMVQAETDYFALDLGVAQHTLSVLDNDLSTLGPLHLGSIVQSDGGHASVGADGRTISFRPDGSHIGSVVYTACTDGHCATGTVILRLDDHARPGEPDSSIYEIWKDDPVTVMVAPGFAQPTAAYYQGSLQPISGQQYIFTPKEGFTGTEVLRFNRLEDGSMVYYTIIIHVRDPFALNGWASKDFYFTELNNPLTLSPLDNDFGDEISSLNTTGLVGSLTAEGAGRYTYTPPAGYRGQTKFQYEVCGEGRCDVVDAYITVHDYEPSPEVWQLTTVKGHTLPIDYTIPIDDYSFEVLQTPSHGSLVVSPDGRSLTYTSAADYVGTDAMSVRYCTYGPGGFSCYDRPIQVHVRDVDVPACQGDCFWPGDFDADGAVTIQDILPLGVNLGATGSSRTDVLPQEWYGRSASSWREVIGFGTPDLKHVDGNGDGVLTHEDRSIIESFYGLAHALVPEPPPAMNQVPVTLELLTPVVEAGDEAVIEVALGQTAEPMAIWGLDFSLELHSQIVEYGSFEFVTASDGPLPPDALIITQAISPRDGRLDVGVVRADKKAITRHGVLGQIRFIVEEDLNGFRSLKDLLDIEIDLKRITILDERGRYASLPPARTFLRLAKQGQRYADLQVFPNPAQTDIQIQAPSDGLRNYTLLDLHGRVVREAQFATGKRRVFVDLRGLLPGLYVLRTQPMEGDYTLTKIEVLPQ